MWPWYNASFVLAASATTLLGNLLLPPPEFRFPSSLAAGGNGVTFVPGHS